MMSQWVMMSLVLVSMNLSAQAENAPLHVKQFSNKPQECSFVSEENLVENMNGLHVFIPDDFFSNNDNTPKYIFPGNNNYQEMKVTGLEMTHDANGWFYEFTLVNVKWENHERYVVGFSRKQPTLADINDVFYKNALFLKPALNPESGTCVSSKVIEAQSNLNQTRSKTAVHRYAGPEAETEVVLPKIVNKDIEILESNPDQNACYSSVQFQLCSAKAVSVEEK